MADEEVKPYVHKSWPKMYYHPIHGGYVVCKSAADVPDHFVKSLDDVSNPVIEPRVGPLKCLDFTIEGSEEFDKAAEEDVELAAAIAKLRDAAAKKRTTLKKAAEKDEPKKDAPKKDASKKKKTSGRKAAAKAAEPEVPTLKSLKLTRDKAMDLLDEEETTFDEDVTDDALAAMVSKLLKG